MDGVWKAAGTVVTSVKRLGEVYANNHSRKLWDFNQATEHRLRQQQRHDHHNPDVGMAVARKRRDNKNRGKGGGTKVVITGVNKGRPGGR